MKPKSLSADELEFISVIESYKKKHHKLFLSWTEVLEIVKDLGYVKVDLHGGSH
jgi:hypothetical protein